MARAMKSTATATAIPIPALSPGPKGREPFGGFAAVSVCSGTLLDEVAVGRAEELEAVADSCGLGGFGGEGPSSSLAITARIQWSTSAPVDMAANTTKR